MESIMKLVIDIEDLFWFVEQYNKYYKEHNGERYLDPRVYKIVYKNLRL